jgi:hypothetical protein
MPSVKWCSLSEITPSSKTTLYRTLECKSRWGALPVLSSNPVFLAGDRHVTCGWRIAK